MSLNFLTRQPWVSAKVNESKLSEIREDLMKEQMNRAHALITSSPPENGTQYVVTAALHCSTESISLASAKEPHLAIYSAAGLNIASHISQLAMSFMFHFILHYSHKYSLRIPKYKSF